MPLPEVFCWTRFGTEAGQPIDEILDRKEQERAANSGMFFWGIGNSIGPSLRELLRCTPSPEVLFSPTRSTPRREDVAPPAVVAWTGLGFWLTDLRIRWRRLVRATEEFV